MLVGRPASAEDGKANGSSFLAAKTTFQTNCAYDPRLAIAVDAVIVHRHGDKPDVLRRHIQSWKQRGGAVGRMFFADSDATGEYWSGKWDGTPHPDEVERNEKDEVVKCAGIRPYMLPTEGWMRYLEEMTLQSIDVGADAILPEEPLAHAFTGYEKAFRDLWARRYGTPWQPESASPEARFLTAQLKSELYLELEQRLAALTKKRARELKRDIAFVMPVHSLYSNYAAHLVAPLGTSVGAHDVDGYIGQVWTGPVNWALANYDSPEKTFFDSAYALYGYFSELVTGSRKRMWMLVDPVEDDPQHTWPEFEQWYRHCVAAMLLFPDVAQYEVMPWPDRIFLPGHATGGGTPAPERFRILTLSATQVLQDVPEGGRWCTAEPSERVGVVMADTLLWEKETFPLLQGVYGLLLPLIHAGVPATTCVAERMAEPGYPSRFRVLVLSFEAWKPLNAKVNEAIAQWVRQGGSLLVFGEPDDLGGADMWWKKKGFASPLHHLMAALDWNAGGDGDRSVGKGWVARRAISPRRFGDPAVARKEYLPLIDAGLRKADEPRGLAEPGRFCMRRGPFVIAHAAASPLELRGRLVDVFEPELPVLDGVRLSPGSSGVYRDVTEAVEGKDGRRPEPQVLHATHRLMSQEFKGGLLRFTVRGPAETPAVVRVLWGSRPPARVAGRDAAGTGLQVSSRGDGVTLGIRFPNHPDGVTVEVAR